MGLKVENGGSGNVCTIVVNEDQILIEISQAIASAHPLNT